MAKKLSTNGAMTPDEMIDRMDVLREECRVLAAKDKPLKEEYDALKGTLIEHLQTEKLEKLGTKRATIALTHTTVPVIDDIESLIPYLKRTKNMHVFLAQPLSTPSWRELVERKGGDLPGTHTFEKIDLSFTSIKS